MPNTDMEEPMQEPDETKPSLTRALSISDVYQVAADIGRDFETIAQKYGQDIIFDLMPKVIGTLENMEKLVNQQSSEHKLIEQLNVENDRLKFEHKKELSNRKKVEDELLQQQQLRLKDAEVLRDKIASLISDNKRLNEKLVDMKKEGYQAEASRAAVDEVTLQRLKSVIEKQKDIIRTKEKELTRLKEELEVTQSQGDQVLQLNQELRKRCDELQERVETLKVKKHSMKEQVAEITQKMSAAILSHEKWENEQENEKIISTRKESEGSSPECEKYSWSGSDIDTPSNDINHIIKQRDHYKSMVADISIELEDLRQKLIRSESELNLLKLRFSTPSNRKSTEYIKANQSGGIRGFFKMFNAKHQTEISEGNKSSEVISHSNQNSQKSSPIIMKRHFASPATRQSTPNLASESKPRRFSFDRSVFSLRSSPRATKKQSDEAVIIGDGNPNSNKNGSKPSSKKSIKSLSTVSVNQPSTSKPKMTRSTSIEHYMSKFGHRKLTRQDASDLMNPNADFEDNTQSSRQMRYESMQLIAQSFDNDSIVISHFDSNSNSSNENQDIQDKSGCSPSSL
ncbi:RILP-like protein 1 [Trichoplax sp. H2]|nr:RILP-like protein 1 [Trichoplax sp. H2]|eukprot:RDD41135.1 RILP-like protein 1 [Trichoplax sp. H2]